MTRIVKEIIEVQNEYSSFNTLIIHVNAGGNDLLESNFEGENNECC